MATASDQPTHTPMPMCPMASMCEGMMKKPFPGVWMIIPGVVFIALGILMVVEPRILSWIVAAAFVLFGAMMLTMVGFMRRMFGGPATHE